MGTIEWNGEIWPKDPPLLGKEDRHQQELDATYTSGYLNGHAAGITEALTPRPIGEFKEGIDLLGYEVGYDWTGKLQMNFLGVVRKEDWQHELTHALEIPITLPTPTPQHPEG